MSDTKGTDKRTVSTDALETLGTIINDQAGRDAIHLAVEPVEAAHLLVAGEGVGLLPDGRAGRNCKHLGIVDPFLRTHVMEGQRFWLVVYPRQITSLRHVWEHPGFPASPATTTPLAFDSRREVSVKFVEDVAGEFGIRYSDFMLTVNHYVDEHLAGGTNKEICFGGDIDAWEVPEGFWDHYEVVSGRKVDRGWAGAVSFRCAC